MRRKIPLIIFLLSLSLLVITLLVYIQGKGETPVTLEKKHTFSKGQTLIMETEMDMVLKDTSTNFYEFGVQDIKTTYDVNGESTLTIVERILPNDDQFIFFKWNDQTNNNEPVKDREIEFPKRINFKLLISGANKHKIKSFAAENIGRPHDNTVGIDEITYPNGLFTFLNYKDHLGDAILGKNYLSKKLIKQYEDGSESFIRQLLKERSSYGIIQSDHVSALTFDMVYDSNFISEQWLMFSKEYLFENEEELSDFILFSNEQYRKVNKWYTAEGVFSKLPWSIEPFVEEGYGRNLNYYREDTVLKRYRDNIPERYYYNLLVNSIAYFENHEKNEDNLFETHYTSTWLKKDYGTTAPYIDSRHNELGAIYINAITDELDLPYNDDPRITYANFMLEQEEINNIIRVSDDAYLIADYYDPSEEAKLTHVSLNHVLGIMNLLLQVYLKTDDEPYLDVATKIHNALMETVDLWIREDHDLWYQVNENFEFDGRDYPILTLWDLIDAEILWQEVRSDNKHLYNKFIESKIKYLLRENVELEEGVLVRLKQANYDFEKLLIN